MDIWRRGGALLLMTSACADDPGFYLPPDNAPVMVQEEVWIDEAVAGHDRAPVDILWVIDTSGSMDPVRVRLRDNLNRFLLGLIGSGVDWRMGMISTDAIDPEWRGRTAAGLDGRRWIDSSVTDPQALYWDMILSFQYPGSGIEQPFKAIDYWLKREQAHEDPFLRPYAALQIIIVTDEREQSGEVLDASAMARMLQLEKGSPDAVQVSHISGPPPDGCSNGTWHRIPPTPRLYEIKSLTGGLGQDICEGAWDRMMSDLGLLQPWFDTQVFQLSETPAFGTLEAWLEMPDFSTGGVRTYQGVSEDASEEERAEVCAEQDCFTWRYVPSQNAVRVIDLEVVGNATLHASYRVQGSGGQQP